MRYFSRLFLNTKISRKRSTHDRLAGRDPGVRRRPLITYVQSKGEPAVPVKQPRLLPQPQLRTVMVAWAC